MSLNEILKEIPKQDLTLLERAFEARVTQIIYYKEYWIGVNAQETDNAISVSGVWSFGIHKGQS